MQHLINCTSTVCMALTLSLCCHVGFSWQGTDWNTAWQLSIAVYVHSSKSLWTVWSPSSLPESGSLLLILDSRVILWYACRLFYLCPLMLCSAVTNTHAHTGGSRMV